jgi:2-aminoadipate transaminase
MGTARVVFDRWDGRYAARMAQVRSSAVRDLFAAASRPDIISFAGGMPEVSRVPAEAAATAAYEAVMHEGSAHSSTARARVAPHCGARSQS